MPPRKNIALRLAGAVVFTLLFMVAILPLIVRSQVVKGVTTATGRATRIDQVTINPLTLTITIRGFHLQEPDGSDFIALPSLRLSLSTLSLLKRALIVDELMIESPTLVFSRLAANTFSFSDILAHSKSPARKEGTSDFRYSINQIRVHNGTIDFFDRAIPGGREHTVKNLEIAIPFISNIPYLAETYTDPQISAIVNGAPFLFAGKVKPLSKSMETVVRINLRQLDLPRYLAYAPTTLPVDLESGTLTVEAEINYKISAEQKPELTLKGQMELEKIKVNLRDGQPLLELPSLQVTASRLAPFSQDYAFSSLSIDRATLFARRDRDGAWMIDHLFPQSKERPQEEKGAPPAAKPLTLSIAELQLTNSTVTLKDEAPAGGLTATLAPIDFSVKNFTTIAGSPAAEYQLKLLLDNVASLHMQGDFTLTPLTVMATVDLLHLPLQRSWPYLQQFLTAPVNGELDAHAEVAYNPTDGAMLEKGQLQVKDLSLRSVSKEGFNLTQLDLSGIDFSTKEKHIAVEEVRLQGGDLLFSRAVDGRISLLPLLKDRPPEGQSPAVVEGAQPFAWSLRQLFIDNFNITVTDKVPSGNPRFILRKIHLAVQGLNGPQFTPMVINFNAALNKGTSLRAQGNLTPAPFHYRGDLSTARLQLRDFADYLPENVHLFIVDGMIDATLHVDVARKEGSLVGSYRGDGSLRSLYLIDTTTEEDLLKWGSLQLEKISGTLAPLRLDIDQLGLSDLYARIVVNKDGTLNLKQLVTVDKVADVEAAPLLEVVAKEPTRTQVAVGSVTLQNGTLVFTDRHLSQTFNSTFHNLGGRVSHLSSEESTRADVDLRGTLDNHSPLQITGQINPLKEDLFVDLVLSCKDIDLSSVTPYSGTYLGYMIEKGKLFLDLNYLIDKKELTAGNKVFIDQFTFGEKVASEKATNLPINLAVALLKDRKGEIHLDLPVTGRTDDPQLSIWGMVWQVLTNLIVKAATSPMALLSTMFGSGQDFSSIDFDSGTSRLTAAEEGKLIALAQGLAERPGLKLEIQGYIDREADSEGYRRELLMQKLRKEKFLRLAKGNQREVVAPGEEVQLFPEEISDLLKAVYKKEKFAKPRNLFGLAKDLPDEEMRKLILASTVVGEEELQLLARERANSVIAFLINKGGLAAERLFPKNDNIDKAPGKAGGSRSRVEFNLIAP